MKEHTQTIGRKVYSEVTEMASFQLGGGGNRLVPGGPTRLSDHS